MRKYLSVAKLFFKAQIVYRFDVALTAIATIWRVLFAWILWGAVFEGHETVSGFTFQAMLSYYLVSSFLASFDMSNGVSMEMSGRIRGGTFSKYMVIPARPQLHFLSQSFGSGVYYALFSIVAAVFCAFAFRVELAFTSSPAALLCAVLMVPLGITFMVGYNFILGIMSFKFQDIGFIWYVQASLVSFFTGAIVPLSLLPDAFVNILRFMPFTYVTYMPAMLITGQARAGEGLFGLAVLSVWTAGTMLAGQFAYERLRVKFDGVGI
jgi:ABC-2 type transport system permease protein